VNFNFSRFSSFQVRLIPFIIKYSGKYLLGLRGKVFEHLCFYFLAKVEEMSKKAKKAEGLEKHKLLQREKDQKRKEKKQVSLPAKHASKGKK
jgi:hypothetical protein